MCLQELVQHRDREGQSATDVSEAEDKQNSHFSPDCSRSSRRRRQSCRQQAPKSPLGSNWANCFADRLSSAALKDSAQACLAVSWTTLARRAHLFPADFV
jgi:hypothetical protein